MTGEYWTLAERKGHWLTGCLREFREERLTLMCELAALAPITRFRLGHRAAYFLAHPDVIRDMFVTEHKHLARERNLRKVFSKTLGNSLLTSDGDYWKRHRRMLAPALHMQQVCTYVDIMVQKAQAVSERWRDGQEAEVEKEMDRLTLGIVTSALFNIDSSAHAGTVERTITELQAIGTRQIARLVQLPDWIPTPENVKQRLMSERLRRIIMGEIRERRARGAGATTCSA